MLGTVNSSDRRTCRNWLRGSCVAALGLLALAPAAASAARTVYVGAGPNVAALAIGPDGTLSQVGGSPFATGGGQTEGVAITPDAKHVYAASFTDQKIGAFNVIAGGGLSGTPFSPFDTGPGTMGPLMVTPSPNDTTLYVANHFSFQIGIWNISPNGAIVGCCSTPFAAPNSPFGITVAPDANHVYVVHENGGGGAPNANTVSAYAVAANGSLSEIPGSPYPAGNNPFGAVIAPNGKHLYVANPEDNASVGSISAYAVAADGSLSAVPGSPFAVAPASHPLGMAISPDGTHLFAATRVSNSVAVFNIAANGGLSQIAGSPFATNGNHPKSVALTPDGKRLYAANTTFTAPGPGGDTVSGFNVAPSGALTLIPGSPFARAGGIGDLESIAITPNQSPVAKFVAADVPNDPQVEKFTATTSTDPDGTVATFDWQFGDGKSKLNGGPTLTHQYATKGIYVARLTVTDNEGCSATRIFTGKATLCNGLATASITRNVEIVGKGDGSYPPAPLSPPPLPDLPPGSVLASAGGAPVTACVVPSLKGKTVKAAGSLLRAARCSLGSVNPGKRAKKGKKSKGGLIASQTPAAGTMLRENSPVNVKLGKAKKSKKRH